MDLAVWYDEPADQWNVFADQCPHRLVPLSEGRVEKNGVIQCAYHGWEFTGDGSCVRIPQLATQDNDVIKSPRACATSFPVRVEQGLLWVFPTPNAEKSVRSEPALIPELDDPSIVDSTNFFVRDLPYSWEVLVENLCDPSHVNFAHHSFMRGADRKTGRDMDMGLNMVEESSAGFSAKKNPYPAKEGKYDIKFQPPCLLYYTLVDEDAKSYLGLGTYCVPVAPGRSRLLSRFPFRLGVAPAMFMIRNTPRWITHLSQNIVMDSDAVFLSTQDETLEQHLNKDKEQPPPYYMPASCDTMVVAYRKWLIQHGQGGPKWLGIPAKRSDGEPNGWLRPMHVPRREGRDALLDRYRQHTEICASCRRAHGVLYKLWEACLATGIGLLTCSAAGLVGQYKRMFAAAGALLLFAPRILLRPLIARLECAPWPRRKWQKG